MKHLGFAATVKPSFVFPCCGTFRTSIGWVGNRSDRLFSFIDYPHRVNVFIPCTKNFIVHRLDFRHFFYRQTRKPPFILARTRRHNIVSYPLIRFAQSSYYLIKEDNGQVRSSTLSFSFSGTNSPCRLRERLKFRRLGAGVYARPSWGLFQKFFSDFSCLFPAPGAYQWGAQDPGWSGLIRWF